MNKGTAIGYMIIAMKNLYFDIEQIKAVEKEMLAEMDLTTEEQAEQTCNRF